MATSRTDTLKVEGMVCDACVRHVTHALMGLAGVQSADVDLAEKRVVVTYDEALVNTAQMVLAILDEGYEASPMPSV
jgi:copper chaperone CopZ